MEKIIPPIDRDKIIQELTKDKFVRHTNMAKNEVYIINYHDSPSIMQEIGRLREVTFRYAGGGTGKSVDIDDYDSSKNPYQQLIVWDPERREILGGYRFHLCDKSEGECQNRLATSELFEFSETFKQEYLPYTIELGRSFVQPDYQSTNKFRKAIFALDNLWDGLGSLVVDHPEKKYLFGKVTIYPSYNHKARDLIYLFMEKHFPDPDKLLYPKKPVHIETNQEEIESILKDSDYTKDHKNLSQAVRKLGENVPPLINAYMNLSSTMRTFGTSINKHFGEVLETGILVTIEDVYPDKVKRHLDSYKKTK